jgi:dienelactone hydrolase
MKVVILLFAVFSIHITVVAQYNVGHTTIYFDDVSRNRQIHTEIYYPAIADGTNETMINDEFPVIVFGHGFVMIYSAYENLWEEFVPKGYIMVFPRTEGNFSPNHSEFGMDLRFLVNAMQQENNDNNSIFYQHVSDNSAIMGHSMGGGASFLAAANNTSIKTVIGLAPAETNPSSIDSAGLVIVPTLILSGSQDGVTPPADHHIPTYNQAASTQKTFIDIIGGAHCYFANSNFNCDFGEGTSSSGISITREEQHQLSYDFIGPWLDYYLKDSCIRFNEFMDSLQTSSRINYQSTQNHINIPSPNISLNGNTLHANSTGDAFQWYLDGILIPGATDSVFQPTQNGNYTVWVSNSSCAVESDEYTHAINSISQIEDLEWSVYPNPCSNLLRIELNEKEFSVKTIRLLSNDGRLVLEEAFRNKLDISSLPSGVYYIHLLGNKSLGKARIIKI